MIDLKTHTLASAPAASQPLLRGLHDQVGFVPNLAACMSESPILLEAFLRLREIAARGSLDPATRELVAIAVATETGCTYCVAAHSTFALKMQAPAATVATVRAGADPDDPRLLALLRFTRALVRRQADVPQRAQEMLATGTSLAGLLDVLVAIAIPMLATSVHQVAAVPVDAPFQANAWTRSA